jgi:hypothetical protein
MDDANLHLLRRLATDFRTAIEATRAAKLSGALPYFPEGACRLTSRFFAGHLTCRTDDVAFGSPRLVSGVLPRSEHGARHSWLEVDGVVVDLTADAFGEASVVVGPGTAFHRSLTSLVVEDAAAILASRSPDETARLGRQLAVIESQVSGSPSPMSPGS